MKPATVYYLVVAALSFGIACAGYLQILCAAAPSVWATVILVVMGLVIGTYKFEYLTAHHCIVNIVISNSSVIILNKPGHT
jgi:hypothetical protein